VIDRGGGAAAESLSRVPTPYSSSGKIVEVSAKPGAAYAYRLTGGEPGLKMGCVDPYMLVESDRQLSTEELRETSATNPPGLTCRVALFRRAW
jgi:hypothetical protein